MLARAPLTLRARLGKGENYAPTFLRLNSQGEELEWHCITIIAYRSIGTVPTLIVPFENTLTPAPGTEARFKAVTDIEVNCHFILWTELN